MGHPFRGERRWAGGGVTAPERKPRTLTCRYHCASCGRHFTSLTAFDRHRSGDYADHRFCLAPEHVNIDASDDGKPARLAVQGIGECRLSGAVTVVGCEVWEAA